jgi:Metallopeptidase family M24
MRTLPDDPLESAKPSRLLVPQLVEHLRLEQSHRGLTFDYALVASGLTFGRAPSNRAWNPGETLSLDTAGYCHGYLADMARMAVMGQPTPLMLDLPQEIRFVQDQTRLAIVPGWPRRSVYEAGVRAKGQCKFGKSFGFVVHGMGLISHEAPAPAAQRRVRLRRSARGISAQSRNGAVNRNGHQTSRGWFHQARRHRGCHRNWVGGIWGMGKGLERSHIMKQKSDKLSLRQRLLGGETVRACRQSASTGFGRDVRSGGI